MVNKLYSDYKLCYAPINNSTSLHPIIIITYTHIITTSGSLRVKAEYTSGLSLMGRLKQSIEQLGFFECLFQSAIFILSDDAR